MKIVIIGAGPVGCYTGYLLASTGHSVTIYENHPAVGSPIQCTGILTGEFDTLGFLVDSFLVNTIHTIEVFSPKKELAVKQKDYIVCRNKFDNFFGDMAIKAGCEIKVNYSFLRKEGNELVIKNKEGEIRVSYDIVIGADGPLSPTAKAFGFYEESRKNYFGVQATVHGNFEAGTIKTYFGEDVCPGLFAWIAPESATTARVGVAAMKNSKHYFDTFMKEQGFEAAEMQAGTIPIYNPKQKLQKGNCYLVGDAATYVKATTLGGLVPGLKQAKILVDCINNKKDYEKEIAPVKKQMWTHLQVQKMLWKFKNADWDRLVEYVGKEKVQKVFEKYTRDNPIPLLWHAFLAEPRFVRFLKYLI